MQSADDSKSVSTNSTEADDHRKIPFPFEPYDVQRQLMRKIYDTLEKGGIGIFESPTGTVRFLAYLVSLIVEQTAHATPIFQMPLYHEIALSSLQV